MELEEVLHAAAGVGAVGAVTVHVPDHGLDLVRHGHDVTGCEQFTARSPRAAGGGHQVVAHELAHATHVRTHRGDARGHGLEHHDRLALVVAREHQ